MECFEGQLSNSGVPDEPGHGPVRGVFCWAVHSAAVAGTGQYEVDGLYHQLARPAIRWCMIVKRGLAGLIAGSYLCS